MRSSSTGRVTAAKGSVLSYQMIFVSVSYAGLQAMHRPSTGLSAGSCDDVCAANSLRSAWTDTQLARLVNGKKWIPSRLSWRSVTRLAGKAGVAGERSSLSMTSMASVPCSVSSVSRVRRARLQSRVAVRSLRMQQHG